jgi:hypothetical protein
MASQVYTLDAEIQLLMPTGNNELENAPLSYYRQQSLPVSYHFCIFDVFNGYQDLDTEGKSL